MKTLQEQRTEAVLKMQERISELEKENVEAKEIIENLLGLLPDEVLNHNYYKEKYVDPAEQFLSEVEK